MTPRQKLHSLFLFLTDGDKPARFVSETLPTSLMMFLSVITFLAGIGAFITWFTLGFWGFLIYFIGVFHLTYYTVKLFATRQK